ncbi:MAG: diacylglycerol kinase family lipid kinase [Verrucomicrobiota bacterium]|nr:diacylglycerol kinase family lipid kinase [Verrucomicrobiota bacterium]
MIVILNRAAGTSAKTEELDAKVREQFAAAGIEAEIRHPDEARDLSAVAREAAKSDGEVIVAGGGDGTISAVAGVLAGTEKTLGVLPLGTLNHFAKDLAIPLDLAAAVGTIARGRVEKVDVAEVNGRVFINNSSLGLYPQIVANREAQQEQLARSKWAAFFWATLHALHRFPFMTLRITLEEKQLVRRTGFLFIGNNEYEIAGFNLGARSCINRGNLGLYLTHRTGRFGLFRLGFRALLGRVEQAQDFDAFCVQEATIETGKRRLLVATDGEVNPMETPLYYRARPGALKVMVPQQNE